MLAANVSSWLRPGAATSPEHCLPRLRTWQSQAQVIPAWSHSAIAALSILLGLQQREMGGLVTMR
jgi:hypothetical protein